jgi:hypothetical protein
MQSPDNGAQQFPHRKGVSANVTFVGILTPLPVALDLANHAVGGTGHFVPPSKNVFKEGART